MIYGKHINNINHYLVAQTVTCIQGQVKSQ